jgi:hypothetical protein
MRGGNEIVGLKWPWGCTAQCLAWSHWREGAAIQVSQVALGLPYLGHCIFVMKYLCIHLSGLVHLPTNLNISPIDTSSNGHNCSISIYITNVNEERERNHLSLLSILLLHFILNTLSTRSSSGQSRITRRSCARQLQGYKGLNGGCSWSCSPPLRMEEFLLHQRPFFACQRRIGLPSLKDTFATAVGHTRAWLCHEDVNG